MDFRKTAVFLSLLGAASLASASCSSRVEVCARDGGKCFCESTDDCAEHYPVTECSFPTCSDAGVCGKGYEPAGTACAGGTCDGAGVCVTGGGGGGAGGSVPFAVLSLDAGGGQTCAITTVGVACWGTHALGHGSDAGSLVPVLAKTDGRKASIVTAGVVHTCALLDGELFCWGANSSGQLGFEGGTQTTPKKVTTAPAGLIALSAGRSHTCAAAEDGIALCWGENNDGQLGNDSSIDSDAPVVVQGLSGVTGISAGSNHTCARLAIGEAYCWGANETGQLGNNTTTSSATPVKVILSTSAATVATGLRDMGTHSCALLGTQEIACWGYNNSGQLGATNAALIEESAVTVDNETASVQLSCSEAHCCSVHEDATVWCWGKNSTGQLGDGSTDDSSFPVQVAIDDVASVSCGTAHTCIVDKNGAAWCWGAGLVIGDGSGVDSSIPVLVDFSTMM